MKKSEESSSDSKTEKMNKSETKTNSPKKKKPWKLIIAAILIGTATGYHFYKLHSVKSHLNDKLETQEILFSKRLDSLNLKQSELIAMTLSWAVRGEMLRGNKEQVNQYFNEFVKVPNILEVQLLKPNGEVELSTNSKSVGTFIKNYGNVMDQQTEMDSLTFRLITPITNLNSKMNVLLVDVLKTK